MPDRPTEDEVSALLDEMETVVVKLKFKVDTQGKHSAGIPVYKLIWSKDKWNYVKKLGILWCEKPKAEIELN